MGNRQQLLEQSKTLKEGKEALLLRKERLGLRRLPSQFDISTMAKKIDELAPGGKYKSANPLPSSPSTSGPWVRNLAPGRLPSSPRRTRSLAIPAPPVLFSAPAKRSSLMLPETPASAWYRGDSCIVSYGDANAEVLCYDHATQLETSADYLWDGNHNFTPYEEEVEFDAGFICEGCGLDDAKELEVESCFAEVENSAVGDAEEFGVDLNSENYYNLCFEAEEACCLGAEVDVCDYGDVEDEEEYCYHY